MAADDGRDAGCRRRPTATCSPTSPTSWPARPDSSSRCPARDGPRRGQPRGDAGPLDHRRRLPRRRRAARPPRRGADGDRAATSPRPPSPPGRTAPWSTRSSSAPPCAPGPPLADQIESALRHGRRSSRSPTSTSQFDNDAAAVAHGVHASPVATGRACSPRSRRRSPSPACRCTAPGVTSDDGRARRPLRADRSARPQARRRGRSPASSGARRPRRPRRRLRG